MTPIGKPLRERTIQPDALPLPLPIRHEPAVPIPDRLPDEITREPVPA